MNNYDRYQSDFCGKECVAKYDESQIQQLTKLRARRIWETLLKVSNTISSEKFIGHLVDVGCGYGHLTVLLAEHFERTTGVDLSPEQILHAKETCTNDRVKFVVGKGENVPVESGSADAITANFCVQYMDINAFVSECLRILKPGGVAVLWADNWGAICSADQNKSQPDATRLVQNLNRDLREIARKQSHPEFHILDSNESLFNEINVTEKKYKLSDRIEIVVSLAEMIKFQMGLPFIERMGVTSPLHIFAKELKVLWNIEDVSDEEIMMRATMEAFPIVIKN